MDDTNERAVSIESMDCIDVTPDSKLFDHGVVGVKVGGLKTVSGAGRAEYVEQLKEVIRDHQFDPNFPQDIIARARSLLDDDSSISSYENLQKLSGEIETKKRLLLNDSPYAEVCSVVSPADNLLLPVSTFRVWVLGTVFTIIGTGLNQFFSLRYPGIYISSPVTQLFSFPCGVAMAHYLPTRRYGWGPWSMTLNPGPFNQKEHILITVMSNVAYGGNAGTAYVTTVFNMLKLDVYFGEKILANSAAFQILLALSTQLLGYGCAGIARRFLVYPPAMIWPGGLAQIALIRALHNDNGRAQVPGWGISRLRFSAYCFIGMFLYFWVPNYLFQAMSFFNWTTWIAPNNVTLAIVTGSLCGLGLNPWPTFDWNVVTLIVDPIMAPFFSTVNVTGGMAISAFFVVPLVYWYNAFNTAYLPIISNHPFDNTGARYNVSRVLNPDYTLNVAEYEAYGRPYIGAGYAISFAAHFAIPPAIVTHVLLYHWAELKTGVMAIIKRKDARNAHNDVHNRLMKAYKEVPEWWFGTILVVSFIISCIASACYPTGMPIWAIILAVGLCVVLQVPIGIITAVTNIEVGNNVLAEFVAGYAIPNSPIANMIFKTFGFVSCAQSVQFSQDLKLGHYLKVPPRTMFAAQVYATIWGAFVAVGVNAWQMVNIKDLCQPDQSAQFTCPGNNSFFTSAIVWGVVGPKRLFGSGGLYNPLEWGFLVGAVLPIPFWFLARKFTNSFVRYIHIPIILIGSASLAPYSFSFIWPACIFGFIFNYYIMRRYVAWWQKYAYVLTSSFRLAIAISAIVIFFAVQFQGKYISWWGNNVSFSGVDGGGETAPACLIRILADGEKMVGT